MKKGILTIFSANLLTAIMSIVVSFLLPKLLPVSSYGEIKSFQFYLTYIGLLHLGYIDGMYLKYGGKKLKNLSEREIGSQFWNLVYFQIVITVICFFSVKFYNKDTSIIYVILALIPYNLLTFYRLFYQAIGEFNNYTRVLLINSILIFIINICLAVSGIEDSNIYISSYVLIYYVSVILAIYQLKKIVNIKISRFDKPLLIANIKNGISLMLGNFAGVLFTGIDRWIIQIFMTIYDFAYYSFAISVMHILEVFISPVTITFYNYLSNHKDESVHKEIKNGLTIVSMLLLSMMFGVKFIVEIFLQDYKPSIAVIFILSASYATMTVIKGLYINLYKVNKMQKTYFNKMLISLIFGLILGVFVVLLSKNITLISLSTFISVLFWEKLCLKDFQYLKPQKKDIFYQYTLYGSFILLGSLFLSVVGFILYIIIFSILTFLLYKSEISYLKKLIYQKL